MKWADTTGTKVVNFKPGRLPRRRNLVRKALREVEQFFSREQWMTRVVQGDNKAFSCGSFGGRAAGASTPVPASSTPALLWVLASTAILQPAARSAPTAHARSQEIIEEDGIRFLKVRNKKIFSQEIPVAVLCFL